MQLEQIVYEKADGIATITLNRPERMNALTGQILEEWCQALTDAHQDSEVRAIIVTGAGRGFCSGMDMAATVDGHPQWEWSPSLADRRNSLRDSVQRIPRLVAQLDKPYIAAVNGPAVGAGMDMASMADIRIASDNARFGMTYVKVGLIPGDGGCWYLPRIMGMAKALELLWTGDLFAAREALRIGYVSAIVPQADLMPYTRELALRLARGPAIAIQLIKRLAYRGLQTGLDEALEAAQHAQLIAQSTEDALEGPRAFVEKRQPQFKGR